MTARITAKENDMTTKDYTYLQCHVAEMARKLRASPNIGPGMEQPAYIAAWIAHDSPQYCNGNNKTWNSKRGSAMYNEVLALLVSSGTAKVVWASD